MFDSSREHPLARAFQANTLPSRSAATISGDAVAVEVARRRRGQHRAAEVVAHAARLERPAAVVQRERVACAPASRGSVEPSRCSAWTKPSEVPNTSSLRLSPSRSTNSGEDAPSVSSSLREAGQQVGVAVQEGLAAVLAGALVTPCTDVATTFTTKP